MTDNFLQYLYFLIKDVKIALGYVILLAVKAVQFLLKPCSSAIPMERPLQNKTNWINLISDWFGRTVISETISVNEYHTNLNTIFVIRLSVITQLLRIFATIFNLAGCIWHIRAKGCSIHVCNTIPLFFLQLRIASHSQDELTFKLHDVVCNNVLR